MKKYIKEAAALLMQLGVFYITPLCAGPADGMGMVLLMVFATLALSFTLGLVSPGRLKFLYPLATAAVFVPSVFLYYNSSALVHSAWYFALSGLGLLVGTGLKKLIELLRRKKK